MAVPSNFYPQVQMPAQQMTPTISTVLVQGEAGAQMYPVAAGNTVFLVDMNANLMWIKSTANNGLPQPIRKFELKEIVEMPQNVTPSNAVTREEFQTVQAKLDELLKALSGGKKNDKSSG